MRRVAEMTSFVVGVLVVGVVIGECGSTPSPGPARQAGATRDGGAALPLRFEPNLGQSDPRVTHISRGADHTLLLTRRGAVLKLRDAAVRMTYVGAQRAPRVGGRGRLAGVSNYLRGRDPQPLDHRSPELLAGGLQRPLRRRRPRVPCQSRGRARVRLHARARRRPGRDPARLRRRRPVARRRLRRARPAAGHSELRQPPPVVYQTRGGVRHRVPASYVLHGRHQVGFALEDYDRRAGLLIDPVLSYSTYLGGSADDYAIWSDVDRAGNFYVTGVTARPTSRRPPARTRSCSAGGDDVFITKLNPSGSGLVWSTYLGGAGTTPRSALTSTAPATSSSPGRRDRLSSRPPRAPTSASSVAESRTRS